MGIYPRAPPKYDSADKEANILIPDDDQVEITEWENELCGCLDTRRNCLIKNVAASNLVLPFALPFFTFHIFYNLQQTSPDITCMNFYFHRKVIIWLFSLFVVLPSFLKALLTLCPFSDSLLSIDPKIICAIYGLLVLIYSWTYITIYRAR